MNILIELGAHYLNNFGDVSMFIVGLERIQALVPSATLYIHTSVPEKIKELFPQVQTIPLNGSALWYQTWFPTVSGWKRFARLGYFLKRLESWAKLRYPRGVLNLYRTWLRLRNRLGSQTERLNQMDIFISIVAKSDIFVMTGHGGLTDEFMANDKRYLSIMESFLHHKKKVFLFGVGMGPLTMPELTIPARKALSRVNFIGIREKRTIPTLLKKFGVPENRYAVTGDDALELAYKLRNTQMGSALGMNIRMASYSEVTDSLAPKLRKAFDDFSQTTPTDFLPIPISISHERISDIEAVRQLVGDEHVPPEEWNRVYDTTEDVIRQISRCRVVVTGSYHAAVFALAQGIPVVGLAKSDYYMSKFRGLLDLFDVGMEVVILDGQTIDQRLTWAIRYLWENAEALRPAILSATEAQIEAGQRAYQTAFAPYQKN
jgi:colanic acid/amylovoran biosynthesis protein